MAQELEALNGHLSVLQEQNNILEKELEGFVDAEEQIKKVLRSRSPPKQRYQAYEREHSPSPVK